MALKQRRKPNEVSLTHCPFCGQSLRFNNGWGEHWKHHCPSNQGASS